VYCGPRHWQRTRDRVGKIPWTYRPVAIGRASAWIAKEVVRPDEHGKRLTMIPATELEIASGEDVARGNVLLDVQTADQVETLLLSRQLRRVRGGPSVVLRGSIVVPQGRVQMRCWSQDDGRELWRLERDVAGRAMRVER
jgi:hypothetical protein